MNTKTLMLAAVTALSLGANAAMAQSEVPSAAPMTYVSGQVAPRTVNTWSGRVQSGSSDVGRLGAHSVPFNGDYSDLANPG